MCLQDVMLPWCACTDLILVNHGVALQDGGPWCSVSADSFPAAGGSAILPGVVGWDAILLPSVCKYFHKMFFILKGRVKCCTIYYNVSFHGFNSMTYVGWLMGHFFL